MTELAPAPVAEQPLVVKAVRGEAQQDEPSVGAISLYLWLGVLIVLPDILLIAVSFLRSTDGIVHYTMTLSNYQRAFATRSVWLLLQRTLLTAAAAASIGAVIAYPMAYYASRILRRGRLMAVLLVIIPLWISFLMRIFAWRLILGERGLLNSFLLWAGILTRPSSALLYNTFAVMLTYAYVSIPFIFISVHAALERIPHSLIEAANDCGASRARAFRSILWPLSRPGLAIGMALAFLLAVGDYVTPTMVGGLNGTMFGVVIASQFGGAGNWPYGCTLAIILLLAVGTALLLFFRFTRVPGTFTGESGEIPPAESRRTLTGRTRHGAGFATFCLPYIFLYAPLCVIAVLSFNDSTLQSFPLSGWTLRWYFALAHNAELIAALARSLTVATLVLCTSIVGGTAFAIVFAFGRLRGAKIAEALVMLPLAIPGVVLGITLVLTFQLLDIPPGLVRVVLGHATFVLPVVMMIVLSRLRRLDPALKEASADLGATPLKTFWFVLLPLLRSAVIGGALLGFTLSFDEVVVTNFLAGIQPTLPVWVWNQMRFGFTPSVNAIFVCIGFATIVLILVSRKLILVEGKRAA